MNADEVISAVFGNTDDAARAVDHVFTVLEATYCAAWDRSLGAAPRLTIKSVWAYQLGQFTHSNAAKRSILWALQNLPDTAPSAIQFRNLCRMAPSPKVLALPEPKADPARLAAEVAKLAPLREKLAGIIPLDCRAWAKNILANPSGRTPTALQMARNAVGAA